MWDVFKKKSSSNWEDSYFGGYRKILIDYPYVKISEKIDLDLPTSYELGAYSSRKLLQIFFLRVKEFNLFTQLCIEAVKSEDGKSIIISKTGKDNALKKIIENDTELSNLFKYYRKAILDTNIEITMGKGEDEEEKEGDMLGGSTKGKDSSDRSPEGAALESIVKDAIDETEKKESFSGYGMASGISDLKKETRFVLMKSYPSPCIYDSDEIFQAKLLVDKLDINFDPSSDRLDGLRMGKLDVAKLASIPAGDQNVYYKIEENLSTKPFSVCMLMDESGSMGHLSNGNKSYSQHKAVKMLYKCFSEILPPDKIYIYGHSGYEMNRKPEVRIYHDKLNPVFEYTINGQGRNSFNENYDGPVIEAVYEKVRSFTSDNVIFISLSDGQPSGHSYGGSPAIKEMKQIIEKCKRDGFVTVGIGLHFEGVRSIYNYNTVIHDLSNASSSISTLINNVVKKEFQQ